ncbi:MAG: succinyl-diaminopimelate desuccinylase [Azospirillaceae bacterium]|nr:succinyl-diaminopimelate desuccinylase [Azospirillaceae bacterium]
MVAPRPLPPLAIARALIRCRSVTPADEGALDVAATALTELGFTCHRLRFEEPGTAPVDNLYARWGRDGRNLCFAGHTDVVPPGELAAWTVDPFAAPVIGDRLYGRGASDMKGAIAAFIAAASHHIVAGRPGSISLLLTGDEEGPSVNGTVKVLHWLAEQGERLDGCIVGEPTNPRNLGDMIKIGRRGSVNFRLRVTGVQGHVAYPHLADNPLPRLSRMLSDLTATPLDSGTAWFEPSSLQVTTVDVGNPVMNVIPAEGRAAFNIRFNDQHSAASLEAWVRDRLERIGGAYHLERWGNADAFLTPPGTLVETVAAAVADVTGRHPEFSTSGGTSDARFIKDYCPVVECGGVSHSIHKVDEHCLVDDLDRMAAIYEGILGRFLGSMPPS